MPTGSSLLLLPPPLFLEIGCIRFTVSNTLARSRAIITTITVLLLLRVLFSKSNSTAKMNILLVYIIRITMERDDHRTSVVDSHTFNEDTV